jgi:hypothetical protein
MKIEQEKTDKVEIVSQVQQKKQIKLIGSQRAIPGLTLWQFNTSTKLLTKAKFKQTNFNLDGSKRHQVVIEDSCIYFQALNRKNALRKLRP